MSLLRQGILRASPTILLIDDVINGGFDTDTDWDKGTGWTIAGGVATYSGIGAINRLTTQVQVARVNGTEYRVQAEFTMSATPSFLARVAINIGGLGENVFALSQNNLISGNSYTIDALLTPTSVGGLWKTQISSQFNHQMDYDIDNVSVTHEA